MDYVLKHHGIKGQKWGARRFQNEDGSYTEAGKERYSKKSASNGRMTDIYANYVQGVHNRKDYGSTGTNPQDFVDWNEQKCATTMLLIEG